MRRAGRKARQERAKALGRIAYRLARADDVCGVIEIDGEKKHIREAEESGLKITLLEPFRSGALENEFSRLEVRDHGRKVLELRWSEAGNFTMAAFEEGEWEVILDDQPAPIPFE